MSAMEADSPPAVRQPNPEDLADNGQGPTQVDRPALCISKANVLGEPARSITAPERWHVVTASPVSVCQESVFGKHGATTLPYGTVVTVVDSQDRKQLRISEPVAGWADLFAPDGALNLAPGGLEAATRWRYRVVCQAGAVVRSGQELSSCVVHDLPQHTILDVFERVVNKQGLARMRTVDGWISEVLNPLSGQRGSVVEPLPLMCVLRYRVISPRGAVVRKGVELMAPFSKMLQPGEVVTIVDRQFSNHPGHRCIHRLQLADGSGWVSLRENRDPPEDCSVLAYEGPGNGENGAAGLAGGLEALRVAAEARDHALEETKKELRRLKGGELQDDDCCIVCLHAQRTATIVHGEIGHVACCLECARIIKARGDHCPVCRQKIDAVVQHFWA